MEVPVVQPGKGFQGLRGQIVVLGPQELDGKDYTIVDLEECEVYLLGSMTALRLHKLVCCKVYSGPVRGSCFLEVCRDSELHVASYQIRVHQTFNTALCMRVKSRPIIEHCEGIRVVSSPWHPAPSTSRRPRGSRLAVSLSTWLCDRWQTPRLYRGRSVLPVLQAPYGLRAPSLPALLRAARLDSETDLWRSVDDFGWIKAVQSPNWAELPESDWPHHEVPASALAKAASAPAASVNSIAAPKLAGAGATAAAAEDEDEL